MIINGDCLVELAKLETESIDCCVTDCPYKICAGGVSIKDGEFVADCGSQSKKWIKKGENKVPSAVKDGKMFANNNIKFSDWLGELFRVMKNGTHTYIMINIKNMYELQGEANKVGFKFQNQLIWAKGNKTPNKYYMQEFENILMLRKGPAKSINNMGCSNIIKIPNIIGNKTHPTEKPVALMSYLIKNSTNSGDIVLDLFMGAGSTGIAAKNLGRNFIGIEIDEEYFNIANNRITNGI